jgi:hypothetical protein
MHKEGPSHPARCINRRIIPLLARQRKGCLREHGELTGGGRVGERDADDTEDADDADRKGYSAHISV